MKAVISVFIDLKKAFDTIDHTILLQKVNHYGIRGISFQWVSSYLTNNMYKLKKQNPPWKKFYVVSMTFVMHHAFFYLLYLQMI